MMFPLLSMSQKWKEELHSLMIDVVKGEKYTDVLHNLQDPLYEKQVSTNIREMSEMANALMRYCEDLQNTNATVELLKDLAFKDEITGILPHVQTATLQAVKRYEDFVLGVVSSMEKGTLEDWIKQWTSTSPPFSSQVTLMLKWLCPAVYDNGDPNGGGEMDEHVRSITILQEQFLSFVPSQPWQADFRYEDEVSDWMTQNFAWKGFRMLGRSGMILYLALIYQGMAEWTIEKRLYMMVYVLKTVLPWVEKLLNSSSHQQLDSTHARDLMSKIRDQVHVNLESYLNHLVMSEEDTCSRCISESHYDYLISHSTFFQNIIKEYPPFTRTRVYSFSDDHDYVMNSIPHELGYVMYICNSNFGDKETTYDFEDEEDARIIQRIVGGLETMSRAMHAKRNSMDCHRVQEKVKNLIVYMETLIPAIKCAQSVKDSLIRSVDRLKKDISLCTKCD